MGRLATKELLENDANSKTKEGSVIVRSSAVVKKKKKAKSLICSAVYDNMAIAS